MLLGIHKDFISDISADSKMDLYEFKDNMKAYVIMKSFDLENVFVTFPGILNKLKIKSTLGSTSYFMFFFLLKRIMTSLLSS